MKRFLAFLTVLVLLPVSLSLAEAETEVITGPVAKTVDELDAMLDSSESVTTIIKEPFYENVSNEDTALEAMGSVMDRLGCEDTTRLVLDTVRSTEAGKKTWTRTGKRSAGLWRHWNMHEPACARMRESGHRTFVFSSVTAGRISEARRTA